MVVLINYSGNYDNNDKVIGDNYSTCGRYKWIIEVLVEQLTRVRMFALESMIFQEVPAEWGMQVPDEFSTLTYIPHRHSLSTHSPTPGRIPVEDLHKRSPKWQ